jgi:hypothetical protein
MNSVRDLPLGTKEQDSLHEEAGLTATVTVTPGFLMVTGHDYAARGPQKTGLAASSICWFARQGQFPAPVRLSPGCTAWFEHEIPESEKDPGYVNLHYDLPPDPKFKGKGRGVPG